MRIVTMLIAAVIVLVVLAGLFFVGYGRERTWALLTGPNDLGPYDFSQEARRKTGNDALACSPGLCRHPDWALPVFDAAPATLIADLAARLARLHRHARRVDDRTQPGYARFVLFSPLMRFPDTLDMKAVRLPDGKSGLRIYSRAKLGRGDFGKNRQHIESLMKGFALGS